MQYILLKCVIKWFFIYSQNCATLPPPNFGTFSSSQKEAHYQLAVTPYSPLPPTVNISQLQNKANKDHLLPLPTLV